MFDFTRQPDSIINIKEQKIASFISKEGDSNIDWKTVDSFGEEWSKFDSFSKQDIAQIGDDYFDIINEKMLNKDSIVLDVGCGTGRWTKYVSQKVKFVEAVDPSDAVISAANLLKDCSNVRISKAEVSSLPFADESFDFVFSLGVLHHIPNTKKAMQDSAKKLKKGGYFLVYLYYNLDNRGIAFKTFFQISNVLRKFIILLPQRIKSFVCDILAIVFYLPFVGLSKLIKNIFGGKLYQNIPLSWYHDKSWNIIRNDALDRFGTPLEQRFTKDEIRMMMEDSGLTNIIFSEKEPFWHAVGKKK